VKIETKYSIGDVVYHGRNETVAVRTECPDCKGSREWAVTTPAGQTMTTGCPTCDALGGSRGFIERYERSPKVETLTIGSVRFNSHEGDDCGQISYMCRETGVGSGSIWYESRLRATREEAEIDAVASIAEDEKAVAAANAHYEKERAKKAARAAKRRAAK
jgi:hypothetical protein